MTNKAALLDQLCMYISFSDFLSAALILPEKILTQSLIFDMFAENKQGYERNVSGFWGKRSSTLFQFVPLQLNVLD